MKHLPVNFYTGNYADYKQLLKDENFADNCLYFCSDKKVIFRGQKVIPVPYVVLSEGETLPDVSAEDNDIIKDILYFDEGSNIVYIYNEDNSKFEPKYGKNIVHIDAIKSIKWDEETKILTLPTLTEENTLTTFTVDFGDELILDSAGYDSNNHNIVLNFKTADEKDTTTSVVKIPVDDLIDIYQGDNTSSIEMIVGSISNEGTVDTRTIKANIRISNKSNNAINIETDGIYSYDFTADVAKAQSAGDTGIANAATAQEKANSAFDIASAIRDEVHGENLKLNSPILKNSPTAPTISQQVDWNTSPDRLATIKYVQEAITYAKTWRALKRNTTWKKLKGGY